MDPLTFSDSLSAVFAQLVLAAGLSVLVLAAVIGWARQATKTDEDTPNE